MLLSAWYELTHALNYYLNKILQHETEFTFFILVGKASCDKRRQEIGGQALQPALGQHVLRRKESLRTNRGTLCSYDATGIERSA